MIYKAPAKYIEEKCIAYSEKKHLDTAHGFNAESGFYTFTKDGKYVIKDHGGLNHKLEVKKGDKIEKPQAIVGEFCGSTYDYALERAR